MPSGFPRLLRTAPFAVFLPLLSPLMQAAESADVSPEAWRSLTAYRFGEAVDLFHAEKGGPPESARLARLGEALALLNRPPVSPTTIAAATRLLEALCAENATDDPALAARYLLARIAHLHAAEPDNGAAAEHYQALIALAPEHPLAEQAVARLALLLLYDPARAERFEADLAEMETLVARLTRPEARRDAHAVLADVYTRRDPRPAEALRHLEAQLATNAVNMVRARNNLLLQIAETARGLGKRELAAARYRQFLEGTRREVRRQLAGERLAEMEGAGS
jgi:hypothetical protein